MTELQFFNLCLAASFVILVPVFIALFFVNAPYGRHARGGWGPLLPNRLAWVLMESLSPVMMLVFFIIGDVPKTLPLVIFLLMWQAHYFHRAFIYPFTISDGFRRMPLSIVLMGLFFNTGNSYLNGRYLFHFSEGYPKEWLFSPQFMIGAITFVVGFVINRWSDDILRKLRKPGERDYKVPYGGFYRWISCPNYFGEIIEWFGWAVATWSIPGLSFALWTFVNLAPRARAHHIWYQETFADYPEGRKALVPGLW